VLLLLGLALATLLSFTLLALPLGAYLASRLESSRQQSALIALALSLIAGFAYSAIAASWSYGLIGIDSYPILMLALGILTWVGFALKKKLGLLKILISGWNRSDFLILIPVIFSVYLTRGQWSGIFSPTLRAGDGPDTSQNLMAAQSARSMGSTWSAQADYFLDIVDKPGLRQGVMELYRLPSFREQAGIDYLVYGTRWGLTVPYSQVLKFFGNSSILWETGFVLLVSLLCLSIVTYSTIKAFAENKYMPLIATLAVVANTPFLVQYFNGGLAQGWALVGTSGMFLALLLFFGSGDLSLGRGNRYKYIFFLIAWLAIAVTYIDAAIVMVLFALVTVIVLSLFSRKSVIPFVKVFFISGLIAALAVPVFTYASLLTFDFRIRAASGTGLPSQIWPLPSEILGFVDIFTSDSSARTSETMLLAILITSYFIYKLIQGKFKIKSLSWLSNLGIAALAVVGVGFVLSITGKLGTNYIYLKVATYIAPLLIISLFLLLDGTKSVLGKRKFSWNLITPALLMVIALTSSYNSSGNLAKQGTNIPGEFGKLLDDPEIQRELNDFNYLTPYITAANFLGVFGNTHWISKAPNDLILEDRLDIELRLICFSVDTTCLPSTERISSPKLESFGFMIFKAPMTTGEFEALTPKARFDENFKAFGQEPQVIPDRFIGGNPYYN